MIRPEVLDALLAAGATADMIVAAVKADGAVEAAALEAKAANYREKGAARQRRHRMSRSVTRDSEDISVTVCDGSPPKEKSPAPPKEITPFPSLSLRSSEPRGKEVRFEFEQQFWPAYPHKTGEPVALRAFSAARKRASLETILAGLDRYKRDKPADRPWLNPATFLSQDRFADQPAPPSAHQSRTTASRGMRPEHLSRVDVNGIAKIYVKRETPQWEAWAEYRRRKRQPVPTDGDGWWFESELPNFCNRELASEL